MTINHLGFDLLAYLAAALITMVFSQRFPSPVPKSRNTAYLLVLTQGVIFGSLILGSANLWLSGVTGVLGKSILGAIGGGIVAIELFKRHWQIRGSTGARLVPGLLVGIIIGRLGCFQAGLADHTYGIATRVPWAVDFGDGIQRHPVQLYECLAMGLLPIGIALIWLSPGQGLKNWLRLNGFYLFALYYAAQRFSWEFLKPYGTLLGPFNVFHLVCLALAGYALYMLSRPSPQPQMSTESPA